MYLGKVVGNVVCSVKDDALVGIRLMLVERLYGGGTVVALDAVGGRADVVDEQDIDLAQPQPLQARLE